MRTLQMFSSSKGHWPLAVLAETITTSALTEAQHCQGANPYGLLCRVQYRQPTTSQIGTSRQCWGAVARGALTNGVGAADPVKIGDGVAYPVQGW